MTKLFLHFLTQHTKPQHNRSLPSALPTNSKISFNISLICSRIEDCFMNNKHTHELYDYNMMMLMLMLKKHCCYTFVIFYLYYY